MKLLVVGVVLLLAHSGYTVQFEDCGNAGEVLAVEINDCPKLVCSVAIGSTANVTIQFRTSVPADNLQSKVVLVISEVEHDVAVRPDPCNAMDEPACPLKTGDVRKYRAQVSITNDCPPVKADLIWLLRSERDDLIVCFATRIHLVAGREADRPAIGYPHRQRFFRSGNA